MTGPSARVLRPRITPGPAPPPGAGNPLALALPRPGEATIVEDDRAWARALGAAMQEHRAGAWSFHLATVGWLTPEVEPPTETFDPRRRGSRNHPSKPSRSFSAPKATAEIRRADAQMNDGQVYDKPEVHAAMAARRR